MSYDAHVSAVQATIDHLNELGATLSVAREKATQALPKTIGAVGNDPTGGSAGAEALASVQVLADESGGPITDAMNGVAHAIEKLTEYRSAWAGGGA